MPQVESLACSSDERLLFVAGGQDDVGSKPSIAALTLDGDLALVVESELDFEGLSTVYCLKTFEESDLLFAGTYSSVLVLHFREGRFTLVSRLADVVPDEVALLRYVDNSLYLASPAKSAIVRIAFPKLAAENRRKSVLGAFSPDFVLQLSKRSAESIELPRRLSSPDRVAWMGRSADGLSLLFKIEGMLHVCVKGKQGFDVASLADSFISFLQLKRAASGRLAYSHATDNRLEVLDGQMAVVAVAEGCGHESPDPKREHLLAQGSYDIDQSIFLWPAGDGYLGVVDMDALEYDLIGGLGGLGAGEYLPVAMQSAEGGRKVASVLVQKASDNCYLAYWQKTDPPRPPITVPAEYLDPERRPG